MTNSEGQPFAYPLTLETAMFERLYTRNAPDHQTRDLVSRTIQVRAATLDEPTRSVEVTISTENPVMVFDWAREMVIEEVLRTDGAQMPEQLPLLANHMRWSLDLVLGSVRQIRRDGDVWVGRAYFAEGDEDADRAWNKVRQGHLRDVSVGYRVMDAEDIPAGMKKTINGREYTAGARTLRISKRWEARELSLVPVGADRNTKVRQEPAVAGKETPMNPQLRKYLESIGLRSDASETEAQAFLAALGGQLRTRADSIGAGTMTLEAAIAAGAPAPAGAQGQGQRSEPPPAPAATAGNQAATNDQVRAVPGQVEGQQLVDRATVERQRVVRIQELARGEVPQELVTRAISEGWDEARAASAFLEHIRASRTPAIGADNGRNPGQAPAAGSSRRTAPTIAALSLGLVLSACRSDEQVQRQVGRIGFQGRWEDAAEQARSFSGMSLLDIARCAVQLDGREVPYGREELVRAAVSGGSLSNIFTTSVNARLMMAWEEAVDTTVGWVEEVDVADFKTQDEIDFQMNSRLKRLPRGKSAEHADAEDTKESWKIYRYAKQLVIDEQDIIDDNFSVLQNAPAAMGEAARYTVPDLVYSLLLANPTLAADSKAVFHTDHSNLVSGGGTALSATSLQAAITAMRKQTKGTGKNRRILNIMPKFLLVPPDLLFTAQILLQSAERIIAADSGGTFNPLREMGIQARSDTRLSTAGVIDPATETSYTGTATNWFLTSGPGRTIKVGYLRGTGRRPSVRSFVLDKGQWGLGWDIKLDTGAAVMDYRGLYKAAGA